MKGEDFLRQNPHLLQQFRQIRRNWGAIAAINYLQALLEPPNPNMADLLSVAPTATTRRPRPENRRLILKALAGGRELNKIQLACELNCPLATISKCLEELQKEGLIANNGRRGRRANADNYRKYFLVNQQEARA